MYRIYTGSPIIPRPQIAVEWVGTKSRGPYFRLVTLKTLITNRLLGDIVGSNGALMF